MPEGLRTLPPRPAGNRLLRVTLPFLAIVGVLVVLATESLRIVSATHAYVGGESFWSKAQKDAVYSLFRYAQTRNEADYRTYLEAIKVPLGDRKARIELEKPEPDLAVVRAGFVEGMNNPDDLDGMIMLFRRFRNVDFMSRAIAIWVQADACIAELDALASKLHATVGAGDLSPASLDPILAGIHDVNRRLTPLEIAFAATLGDASRRTQRLLVIALPIAAVLLGLVAVAMSRWMLRNSVDLEEALRLSEERYDLAVAGSDAGIWDWNVRTGEMYFSPRYKELLGYADHEFPGTVDTIVDCVHPDDQLRRHDALVDHLKTDRQFDLEVRLRMRTGEFHWFHTRGRSVRDEQGRAVRMAGSITDITDRKEAEFQMYAERDRAQVTLESIADAVITTDVRGHVEYLNPIAESLLGWSTLDAQGLPLSQVFRIVEEANRDEELRPIDVLLREMHPVKLAGDTILVRRDGRELAIDASAAPIRDRATRMIGAVLVLKDVTRERARAAQLSHQARHDAMTGLVNRREFEHRLTRSLESTADRDRRHAVLYIDLDRFKAVNDTSGHAAGDALLKEISGLLQRKLRERDTLARIGGDEFAVLLEDCRLEDATRIADGLCKAVAEFRFPWEGRVFRVGICIGLVAVGRDMGSVAQVLSAADSACYVAKHSGRNRVHVYGPGDGTELRLG